MSVLKFQFPVMGSSGEIAIESHWHENEVEKVVQTAIAEIKRIESKYSRYDKDSLLSQINSNSGVGRVAIDTETHQLLNFAQSVHASSNGLFDITSGVLRQAWSFRDQKIPSPDVLNVLLPLIAWENVEFNEEYIYLKKKGMQIDFGGFGKEYAVDRAALVLKTNNIKHGYINLAGDLFVLGPKMNGDAWSMGIQHPREKNSVIATVPMHQGAIATSGDYESFFELNGHRFCHILNPKTGMPVHFWQSISVVAPLTTAAGSASTVAMLLEENAIPYLKETGFSYLAINLAGEIFQN
jgi:FAD:protein FMN transferase